MLTYVEVNILKLERHPGDMPQNSLSFSPEEKPKAASGAKEVQLAEIWQELMFLLFVCC
jgi:hypothetical protein